jgi:hypothetical protein
VKKFIATFIAIIAILALTVPAMADTNTGVTITSTDTPPEVVALTVVPDETPGDNVQVTPEAAIPYNDSFVGLPDTQDGFRKIKFVVEVYRSGGPQAINDVAIDVFYPASMPDYYMPIYGDRCGDRKFEINAHRQSDTTWTATITYDFLSSYVYPDGTPADMEGVVARQIIYTEPPADPTDYIDVDADCALPYDGSDPEDQRVQYFLNNWQTVSYASGWDAERCFSTFQGQQALLLEIEGWMWFHQPAVVYTAKAKSWVGSAISNILSKTFTYNCLLSLYVPFESITYPSLAAGESTFVSGDANLFSDPLTIWANGNNDLEIAVSSTKMVLDYAGTPTDIHEHTDYNTPAKTIEHFDAALWYKDAEGNNVQIGYVEFLADAVDTELIRYTTLAPGYPVQKDLNGGPDGSGGYLPDEDNPILLQACRPAKIEFSVHPEDDEWGQEPGVYAGVLCIDYEAYAGTQLPVIDVADYPYP